MEAVHMGMVDPNDMQVMGIDINDFGALVTDLVTAMNTFMVPQPEQDAILGALAPLCEPILAPPFKNQCPTAQKQETIEATMINANITDNGYNGQPMPPSMVCQDLVIPDDPIDFVAGAEVTVGIDHPWVGDITIKLVSPENKILTLVSRPGLNEVADDGNGAGGDSSNLAAAKPITFKNGAANNPELMGGTIGANNVICQDENPPLMTCEWAPNPGKGPGMNFNDFVGDKASGTWKLCVGDGGAGDQGKLQSVKLVLNRVKYDPTP
jgi:subtilisin-like proprotein convertase family protein